MSVLVRAALLGGLAYVVSRAVRRSSESSYLSRSDASPLSHTPDLEAEEIWPGADQPSTRII